MEEWKCATMDHGAQCVTTCGITQMLPLPADSSDMVKNQTHFICVLVYNYSRSYNPYLRTVTLVPIELIAL